MKNVVVQHPITPKKTLRHYLIYGGLIACLAQGIFLPAIAQQSAEATKIYNQGIQAYQQGNPADALKKFTRATQVDPRYSDAYYNMGSIHYQLAQYEQARSAFQSALALTPNDNQARYNLALALDKLRRYEEALNVLNLIPASDPKSKDAKAKIEDIRRAFQASNPAAANTAALQDDAKKLSQLGKAGSSPGTSNPAASKKMTVETFAKGFDGPTGMSIGPGGFMYVANYSKNLIYKVGAEGQKTVFVQEQGLKGPIGVTYNAKTNDLYVANYLQNTVSKISPDAKVTVLASGLKKPYNLFLDTVNNALYVSEQETNSISRIELP